MIKISRLIFGLLIVCGVCMLNLDEASAENGISDSEILIGSTGALSGVNPHRTKLISLGIEACFNRINRSGGIFSRKLKLKLKDDGYEPNRALANTKELVESENVFAMIGGNGTASANAILPYITAHSIPNLFRFSGGEVLYSPVNHWTFQTRMSYHDEAKQLIDFAVKNLKLKKIAVLYQDDAFGISGRNGVAEALASHNLKIVSQSAVPRNSNDSKANVEPLMNDKPDAVYFQVNIGPAESFIKEANRVGFHPIYLGSSPVDGDEMSKSDKKINDIYVSEVFPSPKDTTIPLIKKYQADMKANNQSQFERLSLEGYIGARVLEEALVRAGKSVTRPKLVETLEAMKDVDIGGIKVSFSSDNHAGLSKIYLNHISQGKTTPVAF